MHYWTKRLFAAAAPLLLAGCLWGPGKFTSDLTVRKNGAFTLDYKGEIVLQLPSEDEQPKPWNDDMARCRESGETETVDSGASEDDSDDKVRPCTAAEIAKLKAQYEKESAERVESKRKENEEMAKVFGLPGFDDASAGEFAAKMMKYEGWRSVTYRGKGVYDVVYHLDGKLTQDFVFPTIPGNDLIIPFIVIRRRTDGSVLVTAPAMTGPAAKMGPAAASMPSNDGPQSHAQGRFTVITDGEILTNNSEDGSAPHANGRQVHWDVAPTSTKTPETLIGLR
jgi:hypothetical protein